MRCERCGDHFQSEYELQTVCGECSQPPSPKAEGVTYDRIERLMHAVEGECDGLAIDAGQAMAILAYVMTGEAPPQEQTMGETDRLRNIILDLQNERLAFLDALKPFAACADEIDYGDQDRDEPTPDEEWAKFRLLVRDYRRARAALDVPTTALRAHHATDLLRSLNAIAEDFIPDKDADAPLALQEMRDAVRALISDEFSPPPSPKANVDDLTRRLLDVLDNEDELSDEVLEAFKALDNAVSAQPHQGQLVARWLPIAQADRTINHVTEFTEIGLTLKNSDTFWVRDEDGRVYRAAWSEGNNGRDYWWDWEAESPVDPVEFMPHPLDPRFQETSE